MAKKAAKRASKKKNAPADANPADSMPADDAGEPTPIVVPEEDNTEPASSTVVGRVDVRSAPKRKSAKKPAAMASVDPDVIEALESCEECLEAAADLIAAHKSGKLPEGNVRIKALSNRLRAAVRIASQELRPEGQGVRGATNEQEFLTETGDIIKASGLMPHVPRRLQYRTDADSVRRSASHGGRKGKSKTGRGGAIVVGGN